MALSIEALQSVTHLRKTPHLLLKRAKGAAPTPNFFLSLREELRKWYSLNVRGVQQVNPSESYAPPAHDL